MITEQLPSLEDIYDYSSSDLKKIIQSLQSKTSNPSLSLQQRTTYQQYIQSINIQLQQRKTLQFFQQLCANQNPFVQKITDFNNQLLKLAVEAIQAQQNTNPFAKKTLPSIEQDSRDEYQMPFQRNEENSKTREDDKMSREDDKMSRATQDQKISRATNEDKAFSVTTEKKMSLGQSGIGLNPRKSKNAMKDFILTTLNKNKAEGCYVVRKGGQTQGKVKHMHIVNDRGHLVNPNTLQPISNKSTKSIGGKEKSTKAMSSVGSSKQVEVGSLKQIQQGNKMSDKQLQKKRQQAVDKVKGIKSEKKKEKPLNNKQLVEMIRQEEQAKIIKERKKQQSKMEANKPKEEIKQSKQMQAKIQEHIVESIQTPKEIAQQLVKETVSISPASEIREQIEQQTHSAQNIESNKIATNVINIEKIENRPPIVETKQIKQDTNKSKTNQINKSKTNQIECIQNIQGSTKILQQQNNKIKQQIQTFQQQPQSAPAHKYQSTQQQNYLAQLQQIQAIKRDLQNQQLQRIASKKHIQTTHSSQHNYGIVTDLTPEPNSQQIVQNTIQTNLQPVEPAVNKRCYNQDYWIHIRQQAQFQIKRFKQQKQLQDRSKMQIKQSVNRSISQRKQQHTQQHHTQQQKPYTAQSHQSQPDLLEQDQFISRQKNQLKKMMLDHNKRRMPKKQVMLPPAPARPIHPMPEFNYLQIYPTFNHIFSVMYTKAQHQALQDVPVIMRDLTNMFSTHIQHFKDKKSYFQPAIFLPFDSTNRFQLTDPRQLLMNAQNTYVNLKKMVQRLQTFNGNLQGDFKSIDHRYYRVVKTKQEVYDIITTGFLRRKGWKELPHGCSLRSSWNLFWSWSKPDIDVSKLLVWQKINHFPFNKNLSRKDLLYKNLDSFRRMLKIPFPFLPITYNLPKQFTQFSIAFHQQQVVNRSHNFWIMKPIGKSRGRGIKVINNLADLSYTDNIVVQKYISNPLLIDGYKFDMRIYVLVTNFHPLQAFVYREGFARFSTQKYSTQAAHITNTYMHLTNFAVNRNNQQAKAGHFSGGSKISLKVLKDKITKLGYSFINIWSQVHQIIIKSLLGCSVSVPAFPTAFQLFGYDIMIDQQGKCHLIQINASPSLQRSYLIDQIVKQSLIDDILDIVDPPDFDKEQLLDIMAQRLAGRRKITPQEDLIALARVLRYKKIRKVGQMPQNLGLFEAVAPSKLSTDLQKMIKSRSGANNPRNID